MAIFLEDAAATTITKKTETISLNQFVESVDYDCHSLNEAIAYSECAWQNILIEAMKAEYKSLSEADETAAEGSEEKKSSFMDKIKEFFKKIIDWCKNMFSKIKSFVSTNITKLLGVSGAIEKFAKDHQKEIIEGCKKAPDTEVTVSAWDAETLPSMQAVAGTFKSSSVDNEDVVEKVKKFLPENSTKVVTIGKAGTLAFDNAMDSKKALSGVKDHIKSIQKPLQETDKAAKKGASTNDESVAQEAKKECEEGKKKTLSASKVLSMAVSVIAKLMKDSHKVNKAAYAVATKKEKPAKEEKVEEKKAEETK